MDFLARPAASFRKMRDVTGRFIVEGTSHDLSVDVSFRGTSSAASFVVSHDFAGLAFLSADFLAVWWMILVIII